MAYSVTFFLGDVPGDKVFDFAEDETAISRVYNFQSPAEYRGSDESGCSSCKEAELERELLSGQVILTDYLIERIYNGDEYQGLVLSSLDRQEVVPYLQKNLHWRISDVRRLSLFHV